MSDSGWVGGPVETGLLTRDELKKSFLPLADALDKFDDDKLDNVDFFLADVSSSFAEEDGFVDKAGSFVKMLLCRGTGGAKFSCACMAR